MNSRLVPSGSRSGWLEAEHSAGWCRMVGLVGEGVARPVTASRAACGCLQTFLRRPPRHQKSMLLWLFWLFWLFWPHLPCILVRRPRRKRSSRHPKRTHLRTKQGCVDLSPLSQPYISWRSPNLDPAAALPRGSLVQGCGLAASRISNLLRPVSCYCSTNAVAAPRAVLGIRPEMRKL